MHFLNRNISDSFFLDRLEDILEAFKSEDVFVTHSVKEFLWGYNDTALELLREVAKLIDPSLVIDPTVGMTRLSVFQAV